MLRLIAALAAAAALAAVAAPAQAGGRRSAYGSSPTG
jgi:hypothetical protein